MNRIKKTNEILFTDPLINDQQQFSHQSLDINLPPSSLDDEEQDCWKDAAALLLIGCVGVLTSGIRPQMRYTHQPLPFAVTSFSAYEMSLPPSQDAEYLRPAKKMRSQLSICDSNKSSLEIFESSNAFDSENFLKGGRKNYFVETQRPRAGSESGTEQDPGAGSRTVAALAQTIPAEQLRFGPPSISAMGSRSQSGSSNIFTAQVQTQSPTQRQSEESLMDDFSEQRQSEESLTGDFSEQRQSEESLTGDFSEQRPSEESLSLYFGAKGVGVVRNAVGTAIKEERMNPNATDYSQLVVQVETIDKLMRKLDYLEARPNTKTKDFVLGAKEEADRILLHLKAQYPQYWADITSRRASFSTSSLATTDAASESQEQDLFISNSNSITSRRASSSTSSLATTDAASESQEQDLFISNSNKEYDNWYKNLIIFSQPMEPGAAVAKYENFSIYKTNSANNRQVSGEGSYIEYSQTEQVPENYLSTKNSKFLQIEPPNFESTDELPSIINTNTSENLNEAKNFLFRVRGQEKYDYCYNSLVGTTTRDNKPTIIYQGTHATGKGNTSSFLKQEAKQDLNLPAQFEKTEANEFFTANLRISD